MFQDGGHDREIDISSGSISQVAMRMFYSKIQRQLFLCQFYFQFTTEIGSWRTKTWQSWFLKKRFDCVYLPYVVLTFMDFTHLNTKMDTFEQILI